MSPRDRLNAHLRARERRNRLQPCEHCSAPSTETVWVVCGVLELQLCAPCAELARELSALVEQLHGLRGEP